VRPSLRPPARLLVPFSRRTSWRPLARRLGAPQPRHAAPLQPWPVDLWIVRSAGAAVGVLAVVAAWRSGLVAWAWMWGGTWTVAAAFMVAAVVTS
jgi:hypothetical protein